MPKMTDAHRRSFFLWFWFAVMAPLYVWYRMYHMMIGMPILDCDEVYNYWEPLHYMLYRTGHQTWEYHADYALRTYAYLVPLQGIARFLYIPFLISSSAWWGPMGLSTTVTVPLDPKAQLFLLLRQSVAGTTAVAELFFLYAVWRYYYKNDSFEDKKPSSATIPVVTAVLLLTCTGMHHAAGALLPSATWMALWCVCAACVLSQYHVTFVVCAVVGTLATGWPFGCVCVLPMALSILYRECVRRRVVAFVTTIVAVTLLVQGVVMAIDYHYYGVLTLPTWNIVRYNAGGNGDELYGVEPLSYYLKNLLLNGNGVFVLGGLALPVYIWRSLRTSHFDARMLSILASLPAWLLMTLPRPHKEERFLFPVYPVLVLGAAVTVDAALTDIVAAFLRRRRRGSTPSPTLPSWNIIIPLAHAIVWTPLILVSLSRSWALHQYYGAPLEVYRALAAQAPHDDRQLLVCTCGEWYRYPSSFLLPDAVVPIAFLPSSFTGQLPQPFSIYGSKPESRAVVQPFNDRNVEQRERYVTNVTRCGWLVDLDSSDDCRAQFDSDSTRFTTIVAVPFLDAAATTSTWHRTLYIPYWHERARRRGQVVYRDYTLYKVEHDAATPEE